MKGYSSLLRAPELEPHHQIQFTVIVRTGALPSDAVQNHTQETHFDGGKVLALSKGLSAYLKPC